MTSADRRTDARPDRYPLARNPGREPRPGVPPGTRYEVYWSYVQHFIHTPFYVYAYAFGDCLVNSLYAVYETASQGFAERYLDMLAPAARAATGNCWRRSAWMRPIPGSGIRG